MVRASGWLLLLTACGGGATDGDATSGTTIDGAGGVDGTLACPLERTTVDRPDDASGHQVHVVYALPSDGVDRQLDTDGTLANTVAVWSAWLEAETGGPTFRLDRSGGCLDVSFFLISRTDGELAGMGPFVRDAIEEEMSAAGAIAPEKLYAVYYDGSSTWSCGGGAWPPMLVGKVGALYLRGAPPGAPACITNPFAAPPAAPGYLEFAMIHEIFHTLGAVAACAPHEVLQGHASDATNDLMWAGDQPWQFPARLDVGRDDYYGHDNAGCVDIGRSVFLDPAGQDLPPGW